MSEFWKSVRRSDIQSLNMSRFSINSGWSWDDFRSKNTNLEEVGLGGLVEDIRYLSSWAESLWEDLDKSSEEVGFSLPQMAELIISIGDLEDGTTVYRVDLLVKEAMLYSVIASYAIVKSQEGEKVLEDWVTVNKGRRTQISPDTYLFSGVKEEFVRVVNSLVSVVPKIPSKVSGAGDVNAVSLRVVYKESFLPEKVLLHSTISKKGFTQKDFSGAFCSRYLY